MNEEVRRDAARAEEAMSCRTLLLCLVTLVVPGPALRAGDADEISRWLESYDRAFVAKDLGKLGGFYHPEATVFEGGGVNRGWSDYRDHHLGPELAELDGLTFSHRDVSATRLGASAAYVTSEYQLEARIGGRDVKATGLETLVLVKSDDGNWRIRHSHTSSAPRRSP
jgi:ketosteroid isomerase-like protein